MIERIGYFLAALWILAGCAKLVSYFADWFLVRGCYPLLAYFLAVSVTSAVVVTVVFAILLLTRPGRKALRVLARGVFELARAVVLCIRGLWWYARHRSPARDYHAANKASGTIGRMHTRDALAVWTDVPRRVEEELADVYEKTIAALFDVRLPSRIPHLRVLCFDRSGAVVAYLRGVCPRADVPVGYYMSTFGPRVVINRETAELFPRTLAHVAAHEFAHHLTATAISNRLPVWLREGLAERVSTAVAPRDVENGAWARSDRVAVERGEQLSASEILSANDRKLWKNLKKWRDPRRAAWIVSLYRQAHVLVQYFAECHGGSWRDYLSSARKDRRGSVGFLTHFGLSPDEAWQAARKHSLAGHPFAEPAPPSTMAARRIETELWPLLTEEPPASDRRRLAIRAVGAAGYAWRADRLIDILADVEDPLRHEAERALEQIAGQRLGGEADAWREWLNSLDPTGVGPRADA